MVPTTKTRRQTVDDKVDDDDRLVVDDVDVRYDFDAIILRACDAWTSRSSSCDDFDVGVATSTTSLDFLDRLTTSL